MCRMEWYYTLHSMRVKTFLKNVYPGSMLKITAAAIAVASLKSTKIPKINVVDVRLLSAGLLSQRLYMAIQKSGRANCQKLGSISRVVRV